MPKEKSIFIAFLNQGSLRVENVNLVTHLQQNSPYKLFVTYPAHKPIANNRNTIVKRFLETDCDYLLMIDGDCIPPNGILTLADYDKDVIGALCFGYLKKMIIPFCMQLNGEGTYDIVDVYQNSGIVECDAVGTGVIMIRRNVLEGMVKPFINEYDPEGLKIKGLDFNFCEKAKKKGYKVYCHTDMPTSHWTTMDLKHLWETFNELRKQVSIRDMKLNELAKQLKQNNNG